MQTVAAAHTALVMLTGTVRDADTGVPLGGAVVEVDELSLSAITDSSGHYVLTRLPGGFFRFTVRLRGYAAWSLRALVPASGRLEIDVALELTPHLFPPIEGRAATPFAPFDQRHGSPLPIVRFQ